MTKTIIVDAAFKEETRIAVLENGVVQDFDREALSIKQIKGNIYLAKVTRVEPSLQAAFVDYGSDRHGFLPFSDIHPDYYQLSEAERQKIQELTKETARSQNSGEEDGEQNQMPSAQRDNNRDNDEDSDSAVSTGSYSVEDETDHGSKNLNNFYKRYNIQDVIKPGQPILVQVLKEERGNKGASMTTYISIAGKYCVLMANTQNKGGVSKKVDNFRDRKLLRSILESLNIPSERSVIIRTAGVGKRPEDLKRDYDYLVKLWTSIKEISAVSNAPCFIHAEDDIIKKCIRDTYNESVSEVVVEGREAYDLIMSFIKITSTEPVTNIKLHDERVPVFNKYKVEQQLNALYEKQVFLPSGGSIVIDHTEALVAIDVNSGKSTNESGVEEMAYNTNIEAVREIAKQLKLRDLAGLVVIDFIDMYDQKHRRSVERALRDALQNDRARIQLGRISVFGLMEMSRQRLGASFFETITDPCKHCNGTGYVRSIEILAVSILRAIRYACVDKQAGVIHVYCSGNVITYILNYKRAEIASSEKNYGVHIIMHCDENPGPNGFNIKRRKSLSLEEKRELDMEVLTGKVNQLGIERDFIVEDENFSGEDDFSSRDQHSRRNKKHNHKNRRDNKGGNHNNRNRNSSQHQGSKSSGKKSILSGVLNLFKKK
jgi:ribonuclease E